MFEEKNNQELGIDSCSCVALRQSMRWCVCNKNRTFGQNQNYPGQKLAPATCEKPLDKSAENQSGKPWIKKNQFKKSVHIALKTSLKYQKCFSDENNICT